MTNPPSGTITFLFTDIEGSTKRWEQHPVLMDSALAHHDSILRQAIEAQGGYIFKTMGDAFCAAFSSAPNALNAACEAQHALYAEDGGEIGAIRVRMALHTGNVIERDGDYFGPPVNRVARLLSTGHGGQTLLSQPTFELVRDNLPPHSELLDMGEHRLKDLQRPEHIFQLTSSGLPTQFPALKTLDYRPNNLPAQPTPFIGREKELAQASSLLLSEHVRLLTLTGPGGSGKTRLGVQLAAEVLDSFKHGVFFVSLAPLTDPNLVTSSIAQALGVRESGSQPLVETLKEYLKDKELLMVLDNFEHLVQAAPLVSQLLASAPQVKVLATSREVLHLRDEHNFPVPPLSLPDPKLLPPLAQLTQYEAVRLFIERAIAAKPDFTVNNDNAPSVAQICHRLDGLPLAIELAAARIRLLTPQAMLARLESRLKVLTGGARDLPARQQTLRNAIEWSYELLDDGEKQLFRRLAVFQGGRTLEAMEVVCNADGDLEVDVLDGVQSLVDKSLMRQEEGASGEARFVMLETIQEYAREKLGENEEGEEEANRRQHALFFLAFAEEAEPKLSGPEQLEWLDMLEREHDNLRAAHKWACERDKASSLEKIETGLRLAGALGRFWEFRCHWTEGQERLDRSLSQANEAVGATTLTAARAKALLWAGYLESTSVRASRLLLEGSLSLYQKIGDNLGIANALLGLGKLTLDEDLAMGRKLFEESLLLYREVENKWGIAYVLYQFGRLACREGDWALARSLYEESLAICRELGDRSLVAKALNNLGIVALEDGDYEKARTYYEQSLELAQELGDKAATAMALDNLGTAEREGGNYEAARSFLERSLALSREIGSRWGVAYSLGNLGETARREEDYDTAQAYFEQSLGNWRELGYKYETTWILISLGYTMYHQRDFRRATTLFREGLSLSQEISYHPYIATNLVGLARVIGAEGQPERAAQLLGAVEALLEATGTRLDSDNSMEYRPGMEAVRAQLEEEAFEKAWAEGRAMSMEQAVEYALEES